MRPRNAALSSLIMAAVAWTCTAQAQPSAMGAATAATNVLSLSASASVEVDDKGRDPCPSKCAPWPYALRPTSLCRSTV